MIPINVDDPKEVCQALEVDIQAFPHKWVNHTNKIVRLLTINDTNFYRELEKES